MKVAPLITLTGCIYHISISTSTTVFPSLFISEQLDGDGTTVSDSTCNEIALRALRIICSNPFPVAKHPGKSGVLANQSDPSCSIIIGNSTFMIFLLPCLFANHTSKAVITIFHKRNRCLRLLTTSYICGLN